MKKIILFVLILGLGTHLQAQEINWMSFEQALKMQKKKPKPIFMDVYTDWCGPCKMLDKNTFHNADVVKFVNENYYAVKFNGEGNEEINYEGKKYTNPKYDISKAGKRNGIHEFTLAMNVDAYPTMLFFDETGKLIQPLKGYYKPKQIEIFLKIFANGDYKKLDSTEKWQAYQSGFKGTFVE